MGRCETHRREREEGTLIVHVVGKAEREEHPTKSGGADLGNGHGGPIA